MKTAALESQTQWLRKNLRHLTSSKKLGDVLFFLVPIWGTSGTLNVGFVFVCGVFVYLFIFGFLS